MPSAPRYFQSLDHVRVATESRVGLHARLIHALELVEVVHVHRAEVGLKRAEDVVHLHAHLLRLVAVDLQVNLRHTAAERAACGRRVDFRTLTARHCHRVRAFLKHIEAHIFTVFDLHLEPADKPQPLNGRRHEHKNKRVAHSAKLLLKPRDECLLR